MLPQDVIGLKYEPPSDAGSGAVAGRSGEYLARWSSQFYGATFAVHFPDSILGALALNSFSEMLRKHYDAGSIRFQLTEAVSHMRSPALVDLLGGTPVAAPE